MTAYLTIRDVAKSYGRATALRRIDMEIARGEFLTLLGPSGSGKTTLLRILAGLLEPDRGALVLDGRDITRSPAWERDIGLVFQNYALFPHMDVRGNVGFGLEMRGIGGAEAARRIDEALDTVSMRDYGARRPSELSGGQQQRIAIARAIAIKPRLLLLDEPLSNLDAVLRQSVRVELRELHQRTGLTTVMVTHDQVEALTLADRVALMDGGELLQIDPPERLYECPASAFAAGFLGSPPANLLSVEPHSEAGAIRLCGALWRPTGPAAAALSGLRGPARLALRPETLRLLAEPAPGAIPGRMKAVEYMGGERLAHVAIDGAAPGTPALLVRGAGALADPGQLVYVLPGSVTGVFDTDSGARLAPAQAGV
ncbi:ABC transporter ATP-binding protein [Citreicella sp. C3M06]|uniref:ABC transporter ATP-binding protein n=1 Tax=Citreicella sp. C3M06 TaxID=2841564 RepID=UPI001C0833F2|nr:ABC transporter ATP-binding protein [Citreicella sp. C3M06]MBU2959345.1 ABC transporter ATP-binding protein [Citreicella sp. C3M06]